MIDSVELGSPKELFRAFNRFGDLDWNAIYKMCRGDVFTQLMALMILTYLLISVASFVERTPGDVLAFNQIRLFCSHQANCLTPSAVGFCELASGIKYERNDVTDLLLSLKPRYAEMLFVWREKGRTS